MADQLPVILCVDAEYEIFFPFLFNLLCSLLIYFQIYDIATGKKIITLTPQISNQYTKNRATFSPTDELVLSDGVLWDVNSGKEIHKLDKLNQTLSGVFHPNGLEVNALIINV